MAFDGADTLWIVNSGPKGLVRFSHAGADLTTSGYRLPSLAAGYGDYGEGVSNLAIDSSGNIWLGSVDVNPNQPGLTKMIGLAVPVVTPLSMAAQENLLGARP